MKNLYFIYIALIFGSLSALQVPAFNRLKNIYDINQAEGIHLIKFPYYKDSEGYGTLPHTFASSDLKFLNSEINWNDPHSYPIKSKKELYIAHVHNGFIAPPFLGTVFDNKQQFLFDITVNPGNPIFWPVEERIKNFKVISYEKIATVQGPTLFYHWLIDRMPSIYLLKKIMAKDPEIRLIINKTGTIPSYVFQYLNLLGIPQSRLIIPGNNTLYHGHNVYFATPFLMEPIPRKLLLKLRARLIDAAYKKLSRQYDNNLVLIIQRQEPDRKIKNIEEIIDELKPLCERKNYKIMIYDAHQSVAEQIQLFNNAKIVIGLMASGLTNTLFVQPDSHVIEIHSTHYTRHGSEWCWWLCSAVNAHYWMIPLAFSFSDHFINCPIKPLKDIIQKIMHM